MPKIDEWIDLQKSIGKPITYTWLCNICSTFSFKSEFCLWRYCSASNSNTVSSKAGRIVLNCNGKETLKISLIFKMTKEKWMAIAQASFICLLYHRCLYCILLSSISESSRGCASASNFYDWILVPGRVPAFSTDTRPEIMRVSVLIAGTRPGTSDQTWK